MSKNRLLLGIFSFIGVFCLIFNALYLLSVFAAGLDDYAGSYVPLGFCLMQIFLCIVGLALTEIGFYGLVFKFKKSLKFYCLAFWLILGIFMLLANLLILRYSLQFY